MKGAADSRGAGLYAGFLVWVRGLGVGRDNGSWDGEKGRSIGNGELTPHCGIASATLAHVCAWMAVMSAVMRIRNFILII